MYGWTARHAGDENAECLECALCQQVVLTRELLDIEADVSSDATQPAPFDARCEHRSFCEWQQAASSATLMAFGNKRRDSGANDDATEKDDRHVASLEALRAVRKALS